jgi:cold shock CspA family protein
MRHGEILAAVPARRPGTVDQAADGRLTVMAVGKILRFDTIKGYGFIEPEDRGEDLFLHVNDLEVDKHLIRAGVVVQFDAEAGERGMKASHVRLLNPPEATPTVSRQGANATTVRPASHATDGDDVLCDVLSPDEFSREVTEVLLRIDPPLTGRQVLAVREQLARLATSFGWIENGG